MEARRSIGRGRGSSGGGRWHRGRGWERGGARGPTAMLAATLRCARRYRRVGRRGSGPGRGGRTPRQSGCAITASPPLRKSSPHLPASSLQLPRSRNIPATPCTSPASPLDSPCSFLSSSYSISAPVHFSCLPRHSPRIPLHPPVFSRSLPRTTSAPVLYIPCIPVLHPLPTSCIPALPPSPYPNPAPAQQLRGRPGPLLLLTPLTVKSLCPSAHIHPTGGNFPL